MSYKNNSSLLFFNFFHDKGLFPISTMTYIDFSFLPSHWLFLHLVIENDSFLFVPSQQLIFISHEERLFINSYISIDNISFIISTCGYLCITLQTRFLHLLLGNVSLFMYPQTTVVTYFTSDKAVLFSWLSTTFFFRSPDIGCSFSPPDNGWFLFIMRKLLLNIYLRIQLLFCSQTIAPDVATAITRAFDLAAKNDLNWPARPPSLTTCLRVFWRFLEAEVSKHKA